MSQLWVRVEVYHRVEGRWRLLLSYRMDHNDAGQRRTLGEQCRNAFEGGQRIVTYPEGV